MNENRKKCAVVLGCGSEPGASIAMALAGAGWSLVLQDVGGYRMRQSLSRRFFALNIDVKWIAADLCDAGGVETLLYHVATVDFVDLVVVTPGPFGADTAIDLSEGLFRCFNDTDERTIKWVILRNVGSTAAGNTESTGMNIVYDRFARRVMQKDMQASFLELRPDLVGGEIADAVSVLAAESKGNYLLAPGEPLRATTGIAGSFPPVQAAPSPALQVSGWNSERDDKTSAVLSSRLASLVMDVLKIRDADKIVKGGMGITPGWDSLKQIEVILAVEKEFGFRFQAAEIGTIKRFEQLQAKVTEYAVA